MITKDDNEEIHWLFRFSLKQSSNGLGSQSGVAVGPLATHILDDSKGSQM